MNNATCSCGDTESHVIAHRMTADGVGVDIWHDGAITGRIGRALPGVPIARPRTAEAVARSRAAAALVADEVQLYDLAELPKLYACARRVAARSGSAGDLRSVMATTERPALAFNWIAESTDSRGRVTVRSARLDRFRWPGLHVWHERGRYELLVASHSAPLGGRPGWALVPTGIRFSSQAELVVYLLSVSRFGPASIACRAPP